MNIESKTYCKNNSTLKKYEKIRGEGIILGGGGGGYFRGWESRGEGYYGGELCGPEWIVVDIKTASQSVCGSILVYFIRKHPYTFCLGC